MSRVKDLPRPNGNNACVIYDRAVEIIRELERAIEGEVEAYPTPETSTFFKTFRKGGSE